MLAALGGALGLYAVSIAIWVPDSLTLPSPVHVAIGWSFVGAGTVAWLRRPDNRTGLLMMVTGIVWFGRDFDWMHTSLTTQVDVLASNLFVALVAHQLVVFPDGRVRTKAERTLVVAAYALATVGYLVTLLGTIANVIVDLLAAAVALAILVQLGAKWRHASPPRRRALAPVIWTGPALLGVVLVMLTLDSGGPWPAPVEEGLHWATLCFVALPVAFLVGVLRTQLHRGAVAELVVELSQAITPAQVREALAKTLGDPSLEIVYWLADRGCYVDLSGQAVQLPSRPERAATVLESGGQPLAALLHDPSLVEEADLVQASGAAARLALENARLQAELRAQLDEVRASRARIVAAGDAERRRIERDLHDGVQQRLLGIRLSFRLLRGRVQGDPKTVDELLTEAEDELAGTLDDLRALARGIHPAVLTDEGLAPALETLSRRAPVPVTVNALPDRPLPADVEAAAYFITAEAMANTAKYAQANAMSITLAPSEDWLVIEISDDGIGGARSPKGGGLAGLLDRIAAHGWHASHQQPARAGHVPSRRNTDTAMTTDLRIVLADDATLIRKGIASLLTEAGLEVVGQAASAVELLACVNAMHPDVAVVDIRMPPTFTDEGLVAVKQLQLRHPEVGVLVLSQYVDVAYAMKLITDQTEGAGYLLKDRVADIGQFTSALRHIANGGSIVDPSLVAELLAASSGHDPLSNLTGRERDVLSLLAQGRTDRGIAQELYLASKTVEAHVRSIFRKLDLPADATDNRRVHAVLTVLRAHPPQD